MNIFVMCVLGMFLLSHRADAKCIRPTHLSKKRVMIKGDNVETNVYECAVKANEQVNFSDNYCKNCGCHSSDHDNT